MLVLTIILLILLILALLRVGLIFEYNELGLTMWLKIVFVKKHISSDGKKLDFKQLRERFGSSKKPGNLSSFSDALKAITNAFKRLKRRLLIKRLVLHYKSAGDDPARVALQYGAANAVFGIIIPKLERNFRIKRRDLWAEADFGASEPSIYAMISVSLAVWEAIYILAALLPMLKGNNRKDVQKDGKRTDKQSIRHNNAEN